MALHNVRAIFFDAVGTLIHPDPPAITVYHTTGRRYGSRLLPDEIARRFRAAFRHEEERDQQNGLRTSEPREGERWRRIVAAVLSDVEQQEACFAELFEHFSRPAVWRCDADAASVLPELARRGFALGLASNYDDRLRTVVAGLPELRPIQHLVISSEVGWRKPAPAFFDALVGAAGLPRGQILLVGDDRANDYEGARHAGLLAILFDPKRAENSPTVPRIARLTELLERMSGEWCRTTPHSP